RFDCDWSSDVCSSDLGTMRYPVFSQELTLYANLDPVAVLNPARTYFAFNGADAGQMAVGAASAVTTYYSGTLGDPFKLLPLSAKIGRASCRERVAWLV